MPENGICEQFKIMRWIQMNGKIGLYMIAILVLSAFAFAEQVVIGVEGTVTTTGGTPYAGPIQLNVEGMGTTDATTNANGTFSALVGSQTPLTLTCGTQYTLSIFIGTTTSVLVGGYKFTACYGTQGPFNVPGTLTVGGDLNVAGSSKLKMTVTTFTKNNGGCLNIPGNWAFCALSKESHALNSLTTGHWSHCSVHINKLPSSYYNGSTNDHPRNLTIDKNGTADDLIGLTIIGNSGIATANTTEGREGWAVCNYEDGIVNTDCNAICMKFE
jgi:hypothetical protein